MDRYYKIDVGFEGLTHKESGDFTLCVKLERNAPKVKSVSLKKIENLIEDNQNYYFYVFGGERISKEKFERREVDIEFLRLSYEIGQKIKKGNATKDDGNLIFKFLKEKSIDEILLLFDRKVIFSIGMEDSLVLMVCDNDEGIDLLKDSILNNFVEIENKYSFFKSIGKYKFKDNDFLLDFLNYVSNKYSLEINGVQYG